MASYRCVLRKSLPWICILVTFSLVSAFSGYGVFSIIMTSFVLTLSTIFFTFSRQKEVTFEEPMHHQEVVVLSHRSTDEQQEPIGLTKEKPNIENISQEKTVQDGADGGIQIQDYMVRSQDLYSESGSNYQSSSSEDSDIDWSYSGQLGQSPECSDDSISDEESLIEIALPSGHYVGYPNDEVKFFKQKKFPDFSSESVFDQYQPNIKELLAEINDMNEEENLIEIDLSMGSIKCSRFEIEA